MCYPSIEPSSPPHLEIVPPRAQAPRRPAARRRGEVVHAAVEIIARDGVETPHREWRDTALLAPRERVDIAFVADNPGDWMFHCHILSHQAGGMMAMLRVG